MTKQTLLAAIEQRLQQPFALEDIKYLPRSPKKKDSGEWVCLAQPYVEKRIYEDRLNELAFGSWSTPYNPPCILGDTLMFPVTITIFDVSHTDYGEVVLGGLPPKEAFRMSDGYAMEAYTQGFRRACARFRLGRYLYRLPKAWVPYDLTTRTIAYTREQKYQLTQQLYTRVGLLMPGTTPSHVVVDSGIIEERSSSPELARSEPAASEPDAQTMAPHGFEAVSPVNSDAGADGGDGTVSAQGIKSNKAYWIALQLKNNEARIQKVCAQYQVQDLDQLSEAQFVHLVNRILEAQKRTRQTRQNKEQVQRVQHDASLSVAVLQ